MKSVILQRIFGLAMVLVTVPFFGFICILSLMAFDGVDPGARAWIFVISVCSVSLLVVMLSGILSWKSFGKKQSIRGFVIALIPTIVLALAWIWLSMQSFS